MKSKLPIKRLSEIAEIQMGQSPKGSSYNISGEGVPLINGPVEFGKTPFSRTKRTKFTTEPTKICRVGDLILCVRGSTTGRMNIAGYDSCIGRGVASIRSEKYQEWVNFFIHANRETIYRLGTGATFPNVSGLMLAKLEIPIPPLSEQQWIVSLVDEAFEAIDIAIDNTKQNLTNARELFESYLNAIFTQKGDGWKKNTLEDICSITSKLVEPRQPEFIDLPHVGAGNMTYLTGELIDVKTAREENLISGKFLFDETMVLYSKIRPYLMKACRPNFIGLCSADVYPLLPNYEILNRDFLFHLLMSKNFTNYAIAGSDRAGMPKVNRDHLFRYITWVPSLSEQVKITKKIDRLAIETQRLEAIYQQKFTALNELKQSILHKAFTGELTANTTDLMTNIEREAIAV